jgi:hypothetical protein
MPDIPIPIETDDDTVKRQAGQAIPMQPSLMPKAVANYVPLRNATGIDPTHFGSPLADAPPVPAIPVGANAPNVGTGPAPSAPILAPKGNPIPMGRKPGIEGTIDPNTQQYNMPPPHQAGVASLWSKAENIQNPYLRVLGEIGAGAARGLDTAGSIVAPGLAARIPGTTANKQVEVAQQNAEENRQTEEGLKDAQTEEARARAGLTTEQAKNAANPKTGLTPEELTIHDLMAGDNGQPRINPKTNQPYTYLEAYTDVAQAKQDTKPTPESEAPLGDRVPQLNNMLQQRYHVLNPGQTLPAEYQVPANATQKDYDRIDKALEAEERARGTKAQQDTVNEIRRQTQENAAESKKDREAKTDTGLKEKVLTYWQPALDSAERFNVMARNYREAVDHNDQQAMLSLLANHLGMTMGLQKGARLTKDIIQEAQKSRPWLQGLAAKFDKDGYLAGVTLTPQQMKQMLSLGVERYREDVNKSRSMAGYLGITDEPPRKINKEAARFYVEESGGDPAKAQAAAQADGWKF